MIGKYIKETFKNLKKNKKAKILTNKKGNNKINETTSNKYLNKLNNEANRVSELVGTLGYAGAEEIKDDPKTKNVNEAKAAVPSMIKQLSNF